MNTPRGIDFPTHICYNMCAMGKKANNTSAYVPYFDDFGCRTHLEKRHSSGYKNIYTVVARYVYKGDKVRTFRSDYGNFTSAMERYTVETQSFIPSNAKLGGVQLVVSTYDGTKKVNEDVLSKKGDMSS